MDESTISKIESLVLAAVRPLDTQFPAILVPTPNGGASVKSLEDHQPHRNRFRGTYGTNVLSEFAAYVKANPGGQGFIQASSDLAATVFFNLGDQVAAGHGDWRAILKPEATAAYHAALTVDVRPNVLTQRELAEWCEDWAGNLFGGTTSDGSPVSLTAAVAAIRNVKFSAKAEAQHNDRDFGATKTTLESIEATAAGGDQLPAKLELRAVPFLGFQERTILLRVALITGDKPGFKLRIVGKEALFEDLAREFRERLLTEIGDAATMLIGSFDPR